MARIEFSPELTALIVAQRNQDQKHDREREASTALNDALLAVPRDEDRVRLAIEVLDEAKGFYEFSIIERVDAERNYKTWVEREQALTAERKTA